MGTVNFKLDATEAKAVKGFLKLVDAQNKVERATRGATAATKTQDTAMGKAGKSAGRELKSMALKWVGVGATIVTVRKGITMLIEEMKRLEAQNRNATMTMMGAVAGAGDTQHWARARRMMMRNMRGLSVPIPEAARLYSAVRGGAPTMGIRELDALMRVAGKGKQAGGYFGADESDWGNVIGTVGKLFPAVSSGDVGDISAYLMQARGRHGKKIGRGGFKSLAQYQQLMKRSPYGTRAGEEGLGLLLSAITSEGGAAPFQALVQRLGEQREIAPRKIGARITPFQAAQRRFYGEEDARERFAMLRGDPALRRAVFTTQAPAIEAMFAGVRGWTPGKFTRHVRAAQQTDLLENVRKVAMGDPEFRNAMLVTEAEAAAERAEYTSSATAKAQTIKLHHARARQRGENVIVRQAGTALETMDVALGLGGVDPALAAPAADVERARAALDLTAAAES